MARDLTLFGLAVVIMLVSGACGSRLPRVRHAEPQALELALDLTQVSFTDLDSGEAVSVASYMERTGRSHLLLVFGSRGCDVCTEKSSRLRDEFVPHHPLFAAEDAGRFELIAISTDPAHARDKVRRYRDDNHFGFLRWSDPNGTALGTWFLPRGDVMGVPFTALVSREGIVWRVTNHEAVSVDELVARAAATVGLGGEVPPPLPQATPDVPKDEPPPPPVVVPARGLARFDGHDVTACAGGPAVPLAGLLSRGRTRFLQLASAECDAVCAKNHAQLAATPDSIAVTLTPAVSATVGCFEGLHLGGTALATSFSTHFDWALLPVETEAGARLPPLADPLVLGFDEAGALVFSHRGPLAEGQPAAPYAARGPDFPLYTRDAGTVRFADLRVKSDYTVLATFEQTCLGCIEELTHWSDPGGLLDLCQANPGRCQVLALETGFPDSLDFAKHHDGVMASLQPHGIRAPVVLDQEPYGDDGQGYLRRVFDGYLSARFPHWEMGYGTVIYDREGLIVADFKPGTPGDPVLDAVRRLTGL